MGVRDGGEGGQKETWKVPRSSTIRFKKSRLTDSITEQSRSIMDAITNVKLLFLQHRRYMSSERVAEFESTLTLDPENEIAQTMIIMIPVRARHAGEGWGRTCISVT